MKPAINKPPRSPPPLPAVVGDLAKRLGAREKLAGETVRLTQTGSMRSEVDQAFRSFSARQTIRLSQCEFRWQARTGPFGLIRITDAFSDGTPTLDVTALGLVPLAHGPTGTSATKGEIMRYLAELAWAPDAPLHNHTLNWDVIDDRRLAVRYSDGIVRAAVDLILDDLGRIGAIFAPDRPRYEDGRFVEWPWHGRFFDYRQHEGRWLPFQAEVAWTIDNREVVVWRGEITGWQVG